MLRFRKLFVFPLLAFLAFLPCPGFAALIYTYDLDSLCYMSTDVVEATLLRRHTSGQEEWKDTFTATVAASIAGQYHVGDKIGLLDLTLYDPAASGQRCILFIARKQFYIHLQPSEVIAPEVTDMLLIDRRHHVRRYFQWMNPGGLLAEGFSPFPPIHLELVPKHKRSHDAHWRKTVTLVSGTGPEDDSSEQSYPADTKECEIIALKWAAINQLRPLLSHDPHAADVSALLDLLRHRPGDRPRYSPEFSDSIALTICSRLADLNDPAAALDALSTQQGEKAGWLSGLETEPFETAASLAYARSVAQDTRQPKARRAAAAEVLRYNAQSFH